MKFLKFFLFSVTLVTVTMLIACKSNDKSSGKQTSEEGSESQVVSDGGAPSVIHAADITKILSRAQAKGKEKNDKAWAMVTADMWEYDFAITPEGSPKKNIFEGHWIDFKDDFSYVKGIYQDTTEAGYYIFDFDNNKQLEIIPLAGGDTASGWRLMTNGEVIIMIGTGKYGNKGWQIKLVRTHAKPTNSNNATK